MIVHRNGHYEVRSEDGKKLLGKHKTNIEALKQLRAIEISKHAGEPGATKPNKK